jgi:Asp-tRNA(Asn)/Glu-tRNA(Gln) amidotransferase C subunit
MRSIAGELNQYTNRDSETITEEQKQEILSTLSKLRKYKEKVETSLHLTENELLMAMRVRYDEIERWERRETPYQLAKQAEADNLWEKYLSQENTRDYIELPF